MVVLERYWLLTCVLLLPVVATGMQAITEQLQQERLQYKQKLQQCSSPVQQLILQHMTPFITGKNAGLLIAAVHMWLVLVGFSVHTDKVALLLLQLLALVHWVIQTQLCT